MATKNGLIELDLDNTANFPELLNYTLKKIDAGISEPYRAVLDGEDIFKVDTKLNKTVLEDLYKLTVIFPSKSSNATKLVVDNCEAVNIIKPNKSSKKVKEGEVCNLIYDEEKQVFLCASGADESSDTSVGIDGSNVLAGHSFVGSDGEIHNGTIPIKGSYRSNIGVNGSVDLPAGYYTGIHVGQNITTQGGQTLPVKLSFTDSYNLDVSIPKGAYFTERPGKQYPEIKIPTNDILNTIGLTGNFIAKPIGGIPALAKRFKAGESQIHYRQYNSSGFGYQEYFINIDVDFTPMCFLTYEGTSNLSSNFGATCLNYDNKNYNSYTEGRYRKDEGTTYSKYSSTWNSSKRITVYKYNTYRTYDTEVTDELYRPNNQVASMKWVAFGN